MYPQSSTSPSINEIVGNQLFLGNLSSAKSPELRARLGITHILSVCQEFYSTGPTHLAISIADCEYEDILVHLPKACEFIQQALDEGGRVLVHCVMGVSRSTTVLAAYRRPCVLPNYGFLKQLDVFAECGYHPSNESPAYISWKRKQQQHVTQFLNQMVDTTPIIPEQLFLSRYIRIRAPLKRHAYLGFILCSEFPDDPRQAQSLIQELGITHVLSISPCELPRLPASVKRYNIKLTSQQDSLLLAIPEACNFIRDAVVRQGLVLVHSLAESKAAIVVCSYPLPLFNRTTNFTRHLELFGACGYAPTADHPLVMEWTGRLPSGMVKTGLCSQQITAAMNAAAASLLSETSLDIEAFGDALQKIHVSHSNKRVKGVVS
ncbi:hypothetical protein VNI00_008420 [Paramarasmius palmivorus]|uniref:Protein-tyrosine-phosphatase n=1 Tax=Paramarasmius palmivorus TaxID=297713 RepID=A0AAW0CZM4_9AGAR